MGFLNAQILTTYCGHYQKERSITDFISTSAVIPSD